MSKYCDVIELVHIIDKLTNQVATIKDLMDTYAYPDLGEMKLKDVKEFLHERIHKFQTKLETELNGNQNIQFGFNRTR